MEELVTVIIPFKNEEKYIRDSIESILHQTYQNLEILCINDYSTDQSVEICNSFQDSRLRVISKTDQPPGLAVSRNVGIDQAKGTYLVFHDADDHSLPDKIERQVNLIKERGPNVIAGTWIRKVIRGELHDMKLPVDNDDIIKGFERVYNRVTIVAGIICARTEVFRRFYYNPNMKYQQDWDFLLRLHESGEYLFYNVPEFLYHYLIKPTGTKFREDWIHYNLLIRKNQQRRKRNLSEFISPEEMYRELRNRPAEYAMIRITQWMVKLKNYLSLDNRGREK